jgi:hypothetical protein
VWATLSPGGLLILQENIKSPTFELICYYDLMFTVDELDALLSEFGEITCYLSTAAARVARDKAGARSVFRVRNKPLS